MTLASIENFKDNRSQLKAALKNTKNWTISTQRFGLEKEYTGSMLRGGIGSIIIDLDALAKSETQLIKTTTSSERQQLNDELQNLTSHMGDEDGEQISKSLDKIKSFLRSLNIRNSELRYTEFITATDELQLRSASLSLLIEKEKSELESLTKSRQELEISIEDLSGLKTTIQASLQSTEEELAELSLKLADLEEKKLKIEQIRNESSNHLASIKSDSGVIDGFVKRISTRELQLEDQEAKTESYINSLLDHNTQQKKYIEEAKGLILESRSALGYATSHGLSAAFNERYFELKSGKSGLGWISGGAIFLIAAISIGLWIAKGTTLDIYLIVARLSLIPLCIAGSWFCASQYVKLKNIAEDYAYKAAVAKSIAGLSAQIGNTADCQETQSQYLSMALNEIHKDPLRSRNLKNTKSYQAPSAEIIKAIDEAITTKLELFTSKLKQ